MSRYTVFAAALLIAGCGATEQGMFVQEDFELYSANQFPGQSSWALIKTGTGQADQRVIAKAAKAGVKCMQLRADANKDAVMKQDLGDLHEDITVEGWLQAAPGNTGGIVLSGDQAELFVGFDPNGDVMLRAGEQVLVQVDLGAHKQYWTYVKIKVRMLAGQMKVDFSAGNEVVRQGIKVPAMNLNTLSLKASGDSTVLFDDVVAWTTPSR